jgi:hypothetical protein
MRTKQEKQARVAQVQRKRERERLLRLKELHKPIFKILSQIKPIKK